ncbi:MAG: TIGR03617 family F420-dependent LLM class oxidoreductase [Actinomycetota bacterium]|nr:TIGR03617 family F420-dependent LLM class oxidoreductase [Actinomycetota bacterium]
MIIDAPLPSDVTGSGPAARALVAAGATGTFTFEGAHDVFVPLVLAAAERTPLDLYTNVAIAFPRSPLHLAHMAHDLHSLSAGRFTLGLGSQVRPHIERRYGSVWSEPAARMRETVLAVKAVLRAWQDGTQLDFHGRFTTHTLMPPTFDPGPCPYGVPPVVVGAVGPRMTDVATEVADGLIVHPLNSERSLREHTLAAVDAGLARAGRDRAAFTVTAGAIVGVWEHESRRDAVSAALRTMVSFYGSTPAYRVLLEADGYGDLQPELHQLSKDGRWADMAGLIDDRVLDHFTLRGTPAEVGAALRRRYGDVVDRVALSPQGGLSTTALAEVISAAAAAQLGLDVGVKTLGD